MSKKWCFLNKQTIIGKARRAPLKSKYYIDMLLTYPKVLKIYVIIYTSTVTVPSILWNKSYMRVYYLEWFHNMTCQQLEMLYRYTLMYILYIMKWIVPYLADVDTNICLSSHCNHSHIYFIQKVCVMLFVQKRVHSGLSECEITLRRSKTYK